MSIKNKIKALIYLVGPKYRKSYSQCGEDIIVGRLLRDMSIKNPFYVDIGTNDPVVFNNTYSFYRSGASGVCVEPNPSLHKKISKKRSRDTLLKIGVGTVDGELDFFVINNDALSTFSKDEAALEEKRGNKIVSTIKVPVHTIDWIVENIKKQQIDFLSIDVEGLDKEILHSINFNKIRPRIICIETRSFGVDDILAQKAIIEFMILQKYRLAGMTPVNSIFVDNQIKLQ